MGLTEFQIAARSIAACLSLPLVLAAVGISGCAPPVPPADVRRPPLPVHIVYPVSTDRLRTTEVCFGKLMARQSVPLTFSRRGIVKRISAEPASRVTRGQAIAELDMSQLDQQQQTLEAALQDARQRARTVAPQSAEATAADRRIRQLQEQLTQLSGQAATYSIVAPFDGVVVRSRLQEGDAAVPGMTAVQLAIDGPLVVVGSVPAGLANRIEPGQPVWVQLGEETIVCSVESVTRSRGDFASVGRELVVVFPDGDEDRYGQIGTVAEMRFFTEQDRTGSWIPLGAVRQSAAQWAVCIVEDGRVQQIDVTVLAHIEEFVFVESDLSAVAVIADGGHRVAAGQPVTAVDVTADYRVPFAQGAGE
ncbi:MAG: efflux RND transporter periplasmic adaptor subunit [Planctomycetaceae bacterium]|nr:efflux RND transporter periplasmic adaptor subunit [Planctomycetaceae bacterium]